MKRLPNKLFDPLPLVGSSVTSGTLGSRRIAHHVPTPSCLYPDTFDSLYCKKGGRTYPTSGTWGEKHELKLNENKTNPIIITHLKLYSRSDFSTVPQIHVNGTVLPFYDEVKNLGMTFNNTVFSAGMSRLVTNVKSILLLTFYQNL